MTRPARPPIRILVSEKTVHATDVQEDPASPNSHCPIVEKYASRMRSVGGGTTAALATPTFYRETEQRKGCSHCTAALSRRVTVEANERALESVRSLNARSFDVTSDDITDLTEYDPDEVREAAFDLAEDTLVNMVFSQEEEHRLPPAARGDRDAATLFHSHLDPIRKRLREVLDEMREGK